MTAVKRWWVRSGVLFRLFGLFLFALGVCICVCLTGESARVFDGKGVVDDIVNLVGWLLLATTVFAIMPGWPVSCSKYSIDRWKMDAYGTWVRLEHRCGIGDGLVKTERVPHPVDWTEEERALLLTVVENGQAGLVRTWSDVAGLFAAIGGLVAVAGIVSWISRLPEVYWNLTSLRPILIYLFCFFPLPLGVTIWQLFSNGALWRFMLGWKAEIVVLREKNSHQVFTAEDSGATTPSISIPTTTFPRL
jgi:hypothetical protein